MMTPRLSRSVAVGLVAAVLVILVGTTGGAFAHDVQHAAHHSAGMHSTGLCAWMCATAGAVITPAFQPVEFAVAHETVFAASNRPVSLVFADFLQARAPPTLL